MSRRVLLACLVGLWFGGAAGAQDRRGAAIGQPVALSPYAPASAYVSPSAFDAAVKPAGGAPSTVPPTVPTGVVRTASARQPIPTQMPAPAPVAPGYPAGYSEGASCDPIARLNCDACGPEERGWVRADYLLWSVGRGSLPTLAVRDAAGTPRGAVGIPGTPGQQTVLGGTGVNGDLRSGFRIAAGYWLDADRQWGVSGDFFFLGRENDGGRASSAGAMPLSRPFRNLATGLPDAELVAFPGVLSGSVAVQSRNTFGGAGAFLQRNLCCDFDECGQGFRVDVLGGYRYLNLSDQLTVREDLLATGAGLVPPGTQFVVSDRFRTENTFHGGLLGFAGEVRRGNWSLDARGGASFGTMHRELTIDGTTTVTVPGQPASVRTGGLLAQRSNIGRYSSDTFSVVPEVGLNLGYQVTPNLRAHVGYTFFYLPNVWRAGDMIDRGIDPAQLRGAAGTIGRPVPVLASTGAAVQGINFGVTLRY